MILNSTNTKFQACYLFLQIFQSYPISPLFDMATKASVFLIGAFGSRFFIPLQVIFAIDVFKYSAQDYFKNV
jgi:hypothetical protein